MMILNDKYPLRGKRSSFIPFQKTDSIRQQYEACGSVLEENHKVYFFSGIEAEVSETKYVIRKINFDNSNYTLTHEKVIFDKNYTLSDFERDFPFSYQNNMNIEGKQVTILINVHPEADNAYFFTFVKNKLTEIYYFSPC